MKFDCGISPDEKYRRRKRRNEAKAARLREWHDWFAWYPVRVGEHDCRWLETVEIRFPDATVWCGFLFRYGIEDMGYLAQVRAKEKAPGG